MGEERSRPSSSGHSRSSSSYIPLISPLRHGPQPGHGPALVIAAPRDPLSFNPPPSGPPLLTDVIVPPEGKVRPRPNWRKDDKARETARLGMERRMLFWGSLRGIAAPLLTAPLARVAVILQAQDAIPAIYKAELAGKESLRHHGIRDSLKRLVQRQGTRSLWRGFIAAEVCSVVTPASWILFSLATTPPKGKHGVEAIESKVEEDFSNGFVHGAVVSIMLYPLQFASIRLRADLSVDPRTFTSTWQCWRETIRRGGFRALYSGVVPFAISGAMAGAGFTILCNRYLLLFEGDGSKEDERLKATLDEAHVFWGTTGATFFTLFNHPLRTVGTRLAMQAGAQTRLYTSALDCTRKLWREGGIRAFYKGGLTSFIAMVLAINLSEGMTRLSYLPQQLWGDDPEMMLRVQEMDRESGSILDLAGTVKTKLRLELEELEQRGSTAGEGETVQLSPEQERERERIRQARDRNQWSK